MYFLKEYSSLSTNTTRTAEFLNYAQRDIFYVLQLSESHTGPGGLKEYSFIIASSTGNKYEGVAIVDPVKGNIALMDNDKTMLKAGLVCKHLSAIVTMLQSNSNNITIPDRHFLAEIKRKYTINNFYIGKSDRYTRNLNVGKIEQALIKLGKGKDFINMEEENEKAKTVKKTAKPKKHAKVDPELKYVADYYEKAYGSFLGQYLFSVITDIYKHTKMTVALPKPIVDALSYMKNIIDERKNGNGKTDSRLSAIRTVGVILYGDPGIGKSLATDIISKYYENDKDVHVAQAITGQPNIRFDVQMLGSDTINEKNVVFSPGMLPTALAEAKKE
jgi:hypothetical protein